MMKRFSAIVLSMALVLTSGWAGSVDLASHVRVYLYRPEVLADRLLGQGLPSDPGVLQSYVWYLRMDESVRSLAGSKGLRDFMRTHRVPGLDLTGHRTFTNAELDILVQPGVESFPDPNYKLRLLKLRGTLTDNRSLPALARLFDLLVLELGDDVDDRGLQFLKSLRQLRVLSVPGSGVTDASLGVLTQLPRLERLSLPNSRITDGGLKQLARLPLRQLDLGGEITDAGLKSLGAMRSLEQLDLRKARVSGAGLSSLASLPLHTLFLGASITDNDLSALQAFPTLKRLDLTGARITDAGIQILARMPQLEEIAVTQTGITAAALTLLAQLPHLRYLDISQTRVSPEALQAMSGFATLQVLSFSSDRRLAVADLKPLGRLPKLHSLVVNGVPLGRRGVLYLKQATAARRPILEWLIPKAEAADGSEAEVDQVLQIASLPEDKSPTRIRGFKGLRLIHESESSLDEIIPSVSNPAKVDEMTDKNFLGEFTIEAGSVKRKK